MQREPLTERDKFDRFVQEAFLDIPASFRKRIENVAIVVEEEPSAHDLRRTRCPREATLLGLYTGIPLTARTSAYGMVLPDRIAIFRGPIERLARNERELRRIVRETLWHEVGHYFGLDEREVRLMEQRWARARRARRTDADEHPSSG